MTVFERTVFQKVTYQNVSIYSLAWNRRTLGYCSADAEKFKALFAQALVAVLGFHLVECFFKKLGAHAPAGIVGITEHGTGAPPTLFGVLAIYFHPCTFHRAAERRVQFFYPDADFFDVFELVPNTEGNAFGHVFEELGILLHFRFANEIDGFIVDGLFKVVINGGFGEICFHGHIDHIVPTEDLLFFIKPMMGPETHPFQSND